MERGSSKHGPELDEQMEGEDESILRTGQPARTEEWREPEPFAPEHLDLELPEDQEPGVPRGMTTGDVELRSDIARWLPPHKLPEDLRVVDAIPRTPIGKVDLAALRSTLDTAHAESIRTPVA